MNELLSELIYRNFGSEMHWNRFENLHWNYWTAMVSFSNFRAKIQEFAPKRF